MEKTSHANAFIKLFNPSLQILSQFKCFIFNFGDDLFLFQITASRELRGGGAISMD